MGRIHAPGTMNLAIDAKPGPWAQPVSVAVPLGDELRLVVIGGMSMRLAIASEQATKFPPDADPVDVARRSFALADALLAQESVKPLATPET